MTRVEKTAVPNTETAVFELTALDVTHILMEALVYFFGAFFRMSHMKSQNICTVAISQRSSGE